MRRAARLSAAVALGLLAGCSSSKSSAPPHASAAASATSPVRLAALVTAASSATVDRGSSRVSTTVASTRGATSVSTGVSDYRHGNADFDVTTTTIGRSVKARVLVVRGVIYVSLPGSSRDGRYLRLDSLGAASMGGSGFDQSTQLGLLLGATDSVHTVGSESVRGVPTRHIAGLLDVRKAIAATKDPARRALLTKTLSSVRLPSRIPMDVWVDGSGLCRRLAEKVSIPAQRINGVAIPAATLTTTSEFYDFGVPVHVTAPAASRLLRLSGR